MNVDVTIEAVTARLELWPRRAPRSAANLLATLPAERLVLLPSAWSGMAMETVLPAGGDWFEESEALGCSLYPGMVAIRRATGEVLISFGTAESRSPAGREYCAVVGRITDNLAPLREVMATSSRIGALTGSLRVANG